MDNFDVNQFDRQTKAIAILIVLGLLIGLMARMLG